MRCLQHLIQQQLRILLVFNHDDILCNQMCSTHHLHNCDNDDDGDDDGDDDNDEDDKDDNYDDERDLRLLRYLITVMKRHDLTKN